MTSFSGKTAYITGAAGAIGRGLARAFAEQGVNVALADIQPEPLALACREMSELGVEAVPFVVDVADRDRCYAVADQVEKRFGKVHFVVNNAGIGHVGVPFDRIPDADFDWLFSVNVFGVINGTKAFLPKLLSHGEGGHIINTSSAAGLWTQRGWDVGLYSATKKSIFALSEGLRDAVSSKGIGVSVLFPGYVVGNLGPNSVKLRPSGNGPAPVPVIPAGLSADHGMDPNLVGRLAVRAIQDRQFHVITHPDLRPDYEASVSELRAAFDWTDRILPQLS